MTDPAPPGPIPAPSTARQGRLSHAVFRLARAHRARAAAMLRALDLHPGQELLLMELFDRDGRRQSELLDRVGLDHSTVSKSLRRMQDAGLLTREPAEDDRRAVVVRLTAKGRALRGPIAELWEALEETSVQELSADEIDAFVRTADTIERSLAARNRPSDGG